MGCTDIEPSLKFMFMIVLRAEEDVSGSKESEDTIISEGETQFNSSYVKSVSTEIVIDRTFTIPGYTYNLTLVSYNMHDITAPNIIMRWHIECQNPVVPEDWSLLYHPNIHYGQPFEMTLQVKPSVALPTRPKIAVYAVRGLPGSGPGEWAMRRWDHAPFYSLIKPDFVVPFYVKDDKSEEAARRLAPGSAYWGPGRIPGGWWEPLRTEENKDTPPPELMMYDEYVFEHMGVEDIQERTGAVESGKSNETNLFSDADGNIGSGAETSVRNYRNFTLVFPTIKYPGSYGFSIVFKNGISE